jgi:hypothetical protein
VIKETNINESTDEEMPPLISESSDDEDDEDDDDESGVSDAEMMRRIMQFTQYTKAI